ncbi:MAG: replication initiation protein [Mucispirillum schaedleri]|nr:replication initiation protein [Mucispirillum schaedleri]
MNEVVKYDNYMNGLKFTGFTATDFNFLMLLCSKLRDKDTSKITISFAEIREKTGYTQCSIKQFVSDLQRMNDKLMKITCKLQTETEIIMFVLFPTFRIDLENQMLTVAVNEDFKFILNELIKNFTRFDLNEFVHLDSKYSKNLYRLLKQYRITGRYEVGLEEFYSKMDCPKAYNNKQFMQNVIKPALKELKENNYFKNLECIVQYAHKKGRPVVGYVFTFDPEERVHSREIEQKNQKFDSKPKKNRDKIKNSRFNNIECRGYDYEALEKQLLNKRD